MPQLPEQHYLSAPVPVLLLVLGTALLYVAARAAVDAMRRGGAGSPPRPGRLALGYWVPVAATAGVAAGGGHSRVALGVVFGSTVAALSLGLGMITYLAPPGPLPASRRAWAFVLAGAILPLIAGFSGHLTATNALMMLVMGAAVWSVWQSAGTRRAGIAGVLAAASSPPQSLRTEPIHEPGLSPPPLDYATPSAARLSVARPAAAVMTPEPPPAPARAPDPPENRTPQPTAAVLLRAIQWLLAVALAIVGARMALLGTARADASSRLLKEALVSAAVLGPLLLLPALAGGADLAQRGRSADAAAALVGLALLNLFLLLPVVILLWYLRSATPDGGSLFQAVALAGKKGEPIPLPLSAWRIDAVVLTLIGLALVPISLGRWALGRAESAGLVVAYFAYWAVTFATSAATRWN